MITSPPIPTGAIGAAAGGGVVVVDTNVALDWLAFGDPMTDALRGHVLAGRWRWLATAAMREELADVLGRPAFRRFDAAAVLAAWDRLTTRQDEPPAGPLRCADPDDQVFIDLALTRGAGWLLTRDRALLDLQRGALARGLRIVRPDDPAVAAPTPGVLGESG